MEKSDSLSASLEKALADHKILARCFESFDKLSMDPSSGIDAGTIREIREVLKKIVDHFAHEEQRLFPALLKADPRDPTAQLVTDLRKEHKSLLRKINRLLKILANGDSANPRIDLLQRLLREFFDDLEQHARKENELFPSLI